MSTISFLRGQPGFPERLEWGLFEAAIVESEAEIECLDLVEPGGAECARKFPAGVAWGAGAELRWRRRRDGLHLVLIDDSGGALPDATMVRELRFVNAGDEPDEVYLWGEWDGTVDSIVERRIPRTLHYPGVTAGRAVLAVKRYEMDLEEPVHGPWDEAERRRSIGIARIWTVRPAG